MPISAESSEADSSMKMFNEIFSGNYQEYLNLTDFNKFIAQFLHEESSCEASRQRNDFIDLNCLIHHGKPIIKLIFLKHLIKNDSLKHIWNFCSEFLVLQKNPIAEDTVKKLLQLQSDFSSLYSSKKSNKSYIFTKNDSNTINSYYAFVKEFFQIPNFRQAEIQYFSGENAFTHAKLLLKSLIRFAPNQSQTLSHLNSTPRYPYDIESPFQNFMSGSGKLALQLRAKNESFNFLEDSAKELINVATDKLNSTALSRIKFNFVNEYYKGYSSIEETCLQVFNTTECYSYNSTVNQKFQSTDTPITVQNENTSITPIINQTTFIKDAVIQNNASPKLNNHTFSNQTDSISHTSALENTHFTFIYKMLTSIGLGAFSGFLNGGSQIILHIAEQKNCSLPTQRLLAVALALANSLTISTLPLIYSIVENLANDETDSLVNSEKLLTCTYAFITSIILQGINAGVQCALPKKTLLKKLLSMLPLFTGLWLLANSDDSILEYISVLAANIITALTISSSLTYFGQKRFPVNRSNDLVEKANENKTFEMKKLKEEKQNNSDAVSEIEKNLTPEEIFFEKIKFTTPKQFGNLKKYLSDIISQIKNLQDSLSDQEHSNRLGKILDIPEFKQGLLYDLMDLEAFPKKFENEYNKCNNEPQESTVIKNNLNYFKTMIKTIYDKLLSDNVNDDCLKDILCSIETKTLKENITNLIQSIKSNLGFIRGITKPIISIHLSEESTEPVHKSGTGILKQDNNGVNYANNRYTHHANSNSDTRLSSDSKKSLTLSASSSRDEEDVQINRPLLEKTRP